MAVFCPIGTKYDYSPMTDASDPFAAEMFESPYNGVRYDLDFDEITLRMVVKSGYDVSVRYEPASFGVVDVDNDYSLSFTLKYGGSGYNPNDVFFGLFSGTSIVYGFHLYYYYSSGGRLYVKTVCNGNELLYDYGYGIIGETITFKYEKIGTILKVFVNETNIHTVEYDDSAHSSIDSRPTMTLYLGPGAGISFKDITVISRTQGTDCQGEIAADFTSEIASLKKGAVTFTDASISANGIDTWLWMFDDGSSSTQQNPIHFYTTLGEHTATLTVTGIDGTSSITKTLYIGLQVEAIADKRQSLTYESSDEADIVVLPFQRTTSFKQEIELDGEPYLLKAYWSTAAMAWFVDILKSSEEVVVSNLRLRIGVDCLKGRQHLEVPKGSLFVIDQKNDLTDIQYDDFWNHRGLQLVYVKENQL